MLSKKNIKVEVLHTVSYRLLLCLLLTCVLAMPGLAVAGDRLNILTSFPPKFYTPFIRKFELLHPDIQVAVLNKKTTSAIDEIMRGNERHFDIFWSSSAITVLGVF